MTFAEHVALGKQHLFDTIVAHLRQQGGRSLRPDGCAYRSTDGGMCAVGCLISPEEYCPTMEGNKVCDLGVSQGLSPEMLELLSKFQRIHDRVALEHWEQSFRVVAQRFQLIYTEPAE